MFRLVKVFGDGSFTSTTISPRAAIKQDRQAAEALYAELGEILNNGSGPKKAKKAYGKKDSLRDKCYTPPYAVKVLFPFLPKDAVIWEPAAGDGYIAWVLMTAGHKVIQTDLANGFDFLKDKPDFDFDIIITNPPYQAQKKLGFIERCYEYQKPWAMEDRHLPDEDDRKQIPLHNCLGGSPVYQHAKHLTDLGISVIPLEYRSKRPHFKKLVETGFYEEVEGKKKAKWEIFQSMIAPDHVLKKWFDTDKIGLALVGGEVSGGLIYLDFDEADLYRQWALSYKPYICRTAVQKTSRGYHAFFRSKALKTGNFYRSGQIMGQVKGEGGYVVCAPSIHPTGKAYEWLRLPGDGIKEIEDITEMGLSRTVSEKAPRRPKWGSSWGKKAMEVSEALNRLASWRVNDYDEWLKIGISLCSLGDEGLNLWHQWSARSSKYDPEILDKKWKTFSPDGDLRLGSLFWRANHDSPGKKEQKWKTL